MKLWIRALVRPFLRSFFIFLSAFYLLYVLIDYSSHTSGLSNHSIQISFSSLAEYYFYIFISKAELLIPIGLTVATVKTVTTLNENRELLAYMCAGLSIRKLMVPFLSIGCIAVILQYISLSFAFPSALLHIRRLEDGSKQLSKTFHEELYVQHLYLQDGSLLLFQKFDFHLEQFIDVYWLPSFDELYHMRSLSPRSTPPQGEWVDHLSRDPNGAIHHLSSTPKQVFPQIHFSEDLLQSARLEPEMFSLQSLFRRIYFSPTEEANERFWTAFYWKITIPWLALFAVAGTIPFCLVFSRHPPKMANYFFSIFGVVAFYLFLDAAQILSKRGVIDPTWTLLPPYVLACCWIAWIWRRSKLIG